jgi:hypothetical protein
VKFAKKKSNQHMGDMMLNQLEIKDVVRVLILRIADVDNMMIQCNEKFGLYQDLAGEKHGLQYIVKKLQDVNCVKSNSYYRSIYEQQGTIAAIREYRKDSGATLNESKNQINNLSRNFNWTRKTQRFNHHHFD